MRHRQFAVWNFVAALGFALFTVAGAYGVGRLVTGHHAAKDIAILVLGLGIGFGLYMLGRHFHRRGEPNVGGHGRE
jgi:hypothetical protein